MASLDAEMEKMKFRQNYPNHWHTDLLRAPQSDPLCTSHFNCKISLIFYSIFNFYGNVDLHFWHLQFAAFRFGGELIYVHSPLSSVASYFYSGPCASYILRKRALYNDMSRYTCCGGYMPCSGRCGESHCPELCLCTEVFLCFANSVASTRFMLQDEFNLQTTKCDNCIIGFMFCLQQVACIFSCIACITGNDELQEASRVLNCCSDMVYCTVCSCMQTQHKVEMDKRDGKFGARPTAAPPVQQMSRLDQPLPPTIAYAPQSYPPPPPPQQPYGYPPPQQQPPMYPPPPLQHHGYPPPNYAPSGVGYPPPGYPR